MGETEACLYYEEREPGKSGRLRRRIKEEIRVGATEIRRWDGVNEDARGQEQTNFCISDREK